MSRRLFCVMIKYSLKYLSLVGGFMIVVLSSAWADDRKDAFDELNMETGGCGAQIENYQNSMNNAVTKIKAQKVEVALLQQQLEQYKAKTSVCSQQNANQQGALITQITSLTTQIQSLATKNQQLSHSIEQVQRKNTELVAQNQQLLATMAAATIVPADVSTAPAVASRTRADRAATPAKSMTYNIENLAITFDKCEHIKQSIICTYNAVSNKGEQKLLLYRSQNIVYTNTGVELTATKVSIAPQKVTSRQYPSHELIQGVNTPIKIYFEDVPVNTDSISKLLFKVGGKTEVETFMMRDIPIVRL